MAGSPKLPKLVTGRCGLLDRILGLESRFHQVHNSRMIWGLMITDGNVEGIEAELFLTCILLIKGK